MSIGVESQTAPEARSPAAITPNTPARSRGFWALIATQFQGAFSDNVLRYLLLGIVVGTGLSKGAGDKLVSTIMLLFSLPFILFSMGGGFLADRYSKRSVTIGTKFMEIGSMVIATLGLALHSLPLELGGLALVATQAALFGPSKYGLLPELLPEKRLSWGNGIIELGTFLAIISGTVVGGVMADRWHEHEVYGGYVLIALACLGVLTSLGVTRVPPAAPEKKFHADFLGDLWTNIGLMRKDRALFLAVLGNTYFWFLGALLMSTVLVYGKFVLGISTEKSAYLNAALAIGIGVGSLAAGYFSAGKIEYGLIPLGSIGITAITLSLGFVHAGFRGVAILLAALGFFSGFFAVPVNALVQHRPNADEKGGVIAATNLLSFVGTGIAAGVYYVLTSVAHLDPRGVFLASAVMTAVGTVYVLILLPEWFMRLVLWVVTNTVYRITIVGRDNIPEKGGALFVCNHMSFVDALLLIASTDRPIRFLVFKGIYDIPAVKPWAKMMKAIPISSEQRPREMIRSLRDASDTLRSGDVVCIFAEGQITRTGQLLPFRRGFERIMKGVDVPIVPVNLDGVWGSIFSFERGRFLWKVPRRVPYPVTVSFGKPMPATSTATEVRHAVQELQSEAFVHRRKRMVTLDASFVRSARMHPRRFLMADGRTPKVRFGEALVKSIFLARRLKKPWDGQEMVGILMPPSVGGALVNYAAALLGKTSVNLNYTASNEVIASCAKQCSLQTVVTSKAFLERFPKMEVPGKTLLLEDIAAGPRPGEKFISLFYRLFLPYEMLKSALGAKRQSLDDLATVIFSSGSTGDPKGVMLTHFNVGANIRQVSQVFMLDKHDKVLGILPFFHSFGFMAGLWMPVVVGVGVVFHPNPLDARAISALVGQYSVTFMVATPTFLQAYIRRCSPEHFGSLQFVLVGAEKLPDRVAVAFEDTFGIRPLEGYGCTECSPVVTVNGRDFRAPGFRQVGARRGRIGHPLPGVTVRIADIDTGAPVAAGTAGLLLVKGPNVMKGYLGRPEKTAEVLHDGWYMTGDVAVMEEDGFITITDRLTRFSKIGGEMVPHIKIEDKLHELAGVTEQVFAVTAVPDEKKGERIAVLHTLADDKLAPMLEKLAQCDLPPLWKPRPNQFFRIEAIPYLGTGKLDLRALKAKAAEIAAAAIAG
ncbi:MAG TPA: acyl-[ACP]--phospholipid O-acyltransferase [Candidatus Koribacter sp.]|jgi:acyl-[acyl-carrier-protein]-phospholipid O-acyltransferase/long-chain-fatty-acid--[acyl-carrier-protein] ligase